MTHLADVLHWSGRMVDKYPGWSFAVLLSVGVAFLSIWVEREQ